ncbi:uncharacterized protein LOC131650202 [Vicia villosa]|uniref:uncharacterized protein LOC131650202 n=1 Tax=Vicia villosa TaxID=3911 RepID=UPI00273ADD7E|nr:uncharacterized protein LOC131650202 [Vicia villosa]
MTIIRIRQSVTSIFAKITRESEELYKIHLTCSLDCTRYLISQGIAFRGHDERSTSLNKGNFREIMDWVKSYDEKVRDTFDRGQNNFTMTFSDIQKELAMCCAHEVTKVIMEELGDRQFFVLIDESRDISVKEQMAVMLRLRFLNEKGKVVERIIALHHVKYTTSEAQKDALYGILDRHILSISRIRGQGYDGASNMRGEFNGLQRKILDENPYAFYVHFYAHHLQLVVVSVATSCSSIHDFFEYISLIMWFSVLEVLSIVYGDGRGQSQAAVLNMDEEILIRGRSRREGRIVTNLHHYCAEIFYVVIDKICVEMDHRFSEGSNVVFGCFSCLDPKNSFFKFDVDKLARLANIYHAEFSDDDRGTIREQLETYVHQVKRHASFTSCEDVQILAMKMVQTEKHLIFPLVYKLIELALILPVFDNIR